MDMVELENIKCSRCRKYFQQDEEGYRCCFNCREWARVRYHKKINESGYVKQRRGRKPKLELNKICEPKLNESPPVSESDVSSISSDDDSDGASITSTGFSLLSMLPSECSSGDFKLTATKDGKSFIITISIKAVEG
jgi:hypothetical protein